MSCCQQSSFSPDCHVEIIFLSLFLHLLLTAWCLNVKIFALVKLSYHVCSFQIPEYCRVLEESEISEHCFDLIFAFDEIVALGYRENVNLAQIRTFTEMDSHEEKVFRAVREVRSHCCVSLIYVCSSLW